MEENVINPQAHSIPGNKAKPALTPHQLYNYHILHPDEPITDEDIRNLKIDSGDVYKDHQLKAEEMAPNVETSDEGGRDTNDDGTDSQKPIASPYDILGG